MGSGGPAGTFAHVEREALARFLEDLVRGREMTCIISLLRGIFVWRVVVSEREFQSRLDPFLLAVSALRSLAGRRDRNQSRPGGSVTGKLNRFDARVKIPNRSSISCPITMADPAEPTVTPPVAES